MTENKLFLVFAIILFLANCSTKLVKTETDYRPVFPLKSKLVCDFKIPTSISPIISVGLKEELLSEKVKTNHYQRNYTWLNRTLWLGLTALTIGWAVAVNDWRTEPTPEDSFLGNSFYISCLAALPLVAVFTSYDWPFSPKRWKKEQVFSYDTSYQFSSTLATKRIRVISHGSDEEKYLTTNAQGSLQIDIRDFYKDLPPDSDLILRFSYNNLYGDIILPANFVGNIRSYEKEALDLYERAQLEENNNKLNEALGLYNLLINNYPDAKIRYEVLQKSTELQDKIKQQKVIQIRQRLTRVSDEKVRTFIGNLISQYESEALGRRIDNLPSSYAKSVIKDGLEMPLSDNECLQEYNNLTLYQKFYAILCYKNYLIKSGLEKTQVIDKLSDVLNLYYETAQKLIDIDPHNMLSK